MTDQIGLLVASFVAGFIGGGLAWIIDSHFRRHYEGEHNSRRTAAISR